MEPAREISFVSLNPPSISGNFLTMDDLAPADFMNRLKLLYPLRNALHGTEAVIHNPWYIVATVAYGSSNRPEGVPLVFQHVLADLKKAQAEQQTPAEAAHKEQLLLARRVRESILKGGLLCGYSRVRIFFVKTAQLALTYCRQSTVSSPSMKSCLKSCAIKKL